MNADVAEGISRPESSGTVKSLGLRIAIGLSFLPLACGETAIRTDSQEHFVASIRKIDARLSPAEQVHFERAVTILAEADFDAIIAGSPIKLDGLQGFTGMSAADAIAKGELLLPERTDRILVIERQALEAMRTELEILQTRKSTSEAQLDGNPDAKLSRRESARLRKLVGAFPLKSDFIARLEREQKERQSRTGEIAD